MSRWLIVILAFVVVVVFYFAIATPLVVAHPHQHQEEPIEGCMYFGTPLAGPLLGRPVDRRRKQ